MFIIRSCVGPVQMEIDDETGKSPPRMGEKRPHSQMGPRADRVVRPYETATDRML